VYKHQKTPGLSAMFELMQARLTRSRGELETSKPEQLSALQAEIKILREFIELPAKLAITAGLPKGPA
jgi:hypothetical protein